jgi:hypothetical protein
VFEKPFPAWAKINPRIYPLVDYALSVPLVAFWQERKKRAPEK